MPKSPHPLLKKIRAFQDVLDEARALHPRLETAVDELSDLAERLEHDVEGVLTGAKLNFRQLNEFVNCTPGVCDAYEEFLTTFIVPAERDEPSIPEKEVIH